MQNELAGNAKSHCKFCRKFFLMPRPNSAYCSESCSAYAKRDRQKAARQKEKDELSKLHSYDLGDQLEFLGMKGEVVCMIEPGQYLKEGWRVCRDLGPNVSPASAEAFAAPTPVSTKRYFIAVKLIQGLKIYCPTLKSIKGKIGDQYESGSRFN